MRFVLTLLLIVLVLATNVGAQVGGAGVSCSKTTGPIEVGVAYTTTCSVTGGTAPYAWSISSGTLPAGLTLSSSSGTSITIGGTPTTAGVYSYGVQLKDGAAQTVTKTFSGTIVPPPSVVCNPNAGPAVVGTAYSATCTVSGGTAPYAWSISAGTLPPGISLSPSSGTSTTISGTPTTPGTYSYTVQSSDINSQAATRDIQRYDCHADYLSLSISPDIQRHTGRLYSCGADPFRCE